MDIAIVADIKLILAHGNHHNVGGLAGNTDIGVREVVVPVVLVQAVDEAEVTLHHRNVDGIVAVVRLRRCVAQVDANQRELDLVV